MTLEDFLDNLKKVAPKHTWFVDRRGAIRTRDLRCPLAAAFGVYSFQIDRVDVPQVLREQVIMASDVRHYFPEIRNRILEAVGLIDTQPLPGWRDTPIEPAASS